MTDFEDRYFQKLQFTAEQISQYFDSAERDLEIAANTDVPEVRFKFAYDALIKIGIALIAKHGYKVRSQPGHHVKVLEKLSEITNDENVEILGNKMRQDRNKDFYQGGTIITDKGTREYLDFVRTIFDKANSQ